MHATQHRQLIDPRTAIAAPSWQSSSPPVSSCGIGDRRAGLHGREPGRLGPRRRPALRRRRGDPREPRAVGPAGDRATTPSRRPAWTAAVGPARRPALRRRRGDPRRTSASTESSIPAMRPRPQDRGRFHLSLGRASFPGRAAPILARRCSTSSPSSTWSATRRWSGSAGSRATSDRPIASRSSSPRWRCSTRAARSRTASGCR